MTAFYLDANILRRSDRTPLTLDLLVGGEETGHILDTQLLEEALTWITTNWPKNSELAWFCRLGSTLTELYGSLEGLEGYSTAFPTDLLSQSNLRCERLLDAMKERQLKFEIWPLSLKGLTGIWLLIKGK